MNRENCTINSVESDSYFVYCHTNLVNGKRYVGLTRNEPQKRWGHGNNYSHCTYFGNAIQKYGWDNFKHEILAQGLTADEACDLERYYIDLWNLTDHRYGYNLHGGGMINKHVSEETRQKLRNANLGKTAWNKGIPMTPKANERLHAKTRGRKHTEEEKRRVSMALKGRKHTAEHIRKVSEQQMKRIVQYTLDGQYVCEYQSLRIAAETLGCSEAALSNNCNHKTKSSCGYKFEYSK